MIYGQTLLNCLDNSGARRCKVIRTYVRNGAGAGDVVFITIRKYTPFRKVKVSQKYMGVIVRTCGFRKRNFGITSNFKENMIVLFKKGNLSAILGTRVKGSVSFDVRKKGFLKVISLATTVV